MYFPYNKGKREREGACNLWIVKFPSYNIAAVSMLFSLDVDLKENYTIIHVTQLHILITLLSQAEKP